MKAGWLIEQLPRVMASDPTVRQFTQAFEEIGGSIGDGVAQIPSMFAVDTAPPELLRWMAMWLGYHLDPSMPEDRQRALIDNLGSIVRRRSTKLGIQLLVAAVTGCDVEVVDSGGPSVDDGHSTSSPFVRVVVGPGGPYDRDAILALVAGEVPAGMAIEVEMTTMPAGGPGT